MTNNTIEIRWDPYKMDNALTTAAIQRPAREHENWCIVYETVFVKFLFCS